MIDIRRILCPIDFSDASRHALEHAVVIAGWYRSRIVALHVGHPMILLSPLVLFTDPPGAILPTEPDRQQLRQQLREWLVPAEKAGLETEALFDEGNSVARILERARSLPADLIVMGTHGRGGFERLILGSVTERILRKAKCPVLTVPPPATASSKLPFKQMLCPIDFSEPSISALQFAFSIVAVGRPGVSEALVRPFRVPPAVGGGDQAAVGGPDFRGRAAVVRPGAEVELGEAVPSNPGARRGGAHRSHRDGRAWAQRPRRDAVWVDHKSHRAAGIVSGPHTEEVMPP